MGQCAAHGLAAGPDGQCVLCRREMAPVPAGPPQGERIRRGSSPSFASRLLTLFGLCVFAGLLWGAWWVVTEFRNGLMMETDPEAQYANNPTLKEMLLQMSSSYCLMGIECNARNFKKVYPGGLEHCEQTLVKELPMIMAKQRTEVDLNVHVRCDQPGIDRCLSALDNRECDAPPESLPDPCKTCFGLD